MEEIKIGKSTILYGGFAGASAACSVAHGIDYATQKAAIIQEHLSRAPELTDKVLEVANKAAENIGSGDFLAGVGLGVVAGLFAGLALYEATKTRRG